MEIIFENVCFEFNSEKILNNINLKILEGKKYSFVGKSGSGKTSILKIINESIKSTSGNVIVDSEKVFKSVGYVTKYKSDMFVSKFVKDELLLSMKIHEIKGKQERLSDVLKIVGLNESYLHKKIDDLNLSELKKVQLASILVCNPDIILLDEPTIYLNFREKKELLKILNFINEKYKKTIIVTSRDVNFVYEFNSYNFILNDGNLVMEGNSSILTLDKLASYGLNIPDICSFINCARSKGARLSDYRDIKDLIKGVCNNVL